MSNTRFDTSKYKYLTKEEKQQFKHLEALFSHPAWAILQEMCEVRSNQLLHQAANAESWEQNRFCAGARQAYQTIARFDETSEFHFNQVTGQREEAALQAKEDAEADDLSGI